MNLLVHHIFYRPEPIGNGTYTADMCEWLAARGHGVRVVCPPPYYPYWAIQRPYRGWKYVREEIAGVAVSRCPIWVPSKARGVFRVLHSLSFAVSSLPVLIREAHRRPDVVFVIEPSFLNAMCSLVVARAFGLPCWFHIQDLELDIAFELGQFRQKGLRSMLRRLESWALRRFDVVSTISGRMIDRLESKGLERSRIVHFPNWVDTSWIHPAKSNGFRRALGVDEGKVVALYSGTLGPKQGLELVLGAARDLSSEKEIQFIVCGEGSQLASLRRSAQGLSNVLFIPLQPLERLNDLLNIADIHILPQRPEVADLVMPSKLLGMAASGRPVVAVAGPDTEVFRAVRRFGIVVPPEDPSAFAGAIRQLAGNQALRAKLGALARQYALERFGRDRILSEFEESLVKRIPHKPAKMKARQMTASG